MAPEWDLVRRIWPFALPTAAAALGIGVLFGDAGTGWSAATAIGLVLANFVAFGWSMAWAASISPVAVVAVGLGGFIVRLGLIVVMIALLDRTVWFSLAPFLAALVPTTVALLGAEMKILSGRLQSDLWTFPGERELTR